MLDGKEYVFPVLENTSAYLMVLTEMLVQGYGGIIRLFPGWKEGKPASFRNIRVEGGFLVFSSYNGKEVIFCRIKSLKGGKVTLKSPWKEIFISHNGGKNFAEVKGEKGYIPIKMKEGKEIILSPVLEYRKPPLFNKDSLPSPKKMVFPDGSRIWYGKPEWKEYYT
ncbi:MAG: hypothetical protein NC905_00710 [Candidatus Omnitrophica bacterium]|nr:hypothetical protein [Candidatus Omnitrophota bacterium]MCM8776776.1 hypothetical protein [Candidatus Omnitrophota bacterium]